MASAANTRGMSPSVSSSTLLVKEGFLSKKRGILKGWSRKYFMLNKQSLVYFKREQGSISPTQPQGRLFLSDIVKMDREAMDTKKQHVFTLHTKKRAILLNASSSQERESWLAAIEGAFKSEGEAERKDPFRRTLRRLVPGLKRVTLMKDPTKGIGCTIKSAAGHIFVNRIIEDGPIAHTGVLRPDDELLDVNGVSIAGMTVAEVGKVIQSCPDEFLATVRPITTLKRIRPDDVGRVNYVTILPNLGPTLPVSSDKPSDLSNSPVFMMKVTSEEPSSADSLEDVGFYGDENDASGGENSPPPPTVPVNMDNGQPPPIQAAADECSPTVTPLHSNKSPSSTPTPGLV